MEEQELISKIRELKQIKPRQEWVVFAKQNLFEEKTVISSQKISSAERLSMVLDIFPRVVSHLNYKYALATCMFMFLMASSVFIYAQNALPGDSLFAVKKLTEKAGTLLTSNVQSPENQLEITTKRLNELAQITETKQSQRLAPAIKEFQASVKDAVANIKNMRGSQDLSKGLIAQARKLEESKQRAEVRGVAVGDMTELDNALADLIKIEIKDLESKTLTEEQTKDLQLAKESFEKKKYSDALEIILELTQEQYSK